MPLRNISFSLLLTMAFFSFNAGLIAEDKPDSKLPLAGGKLQITLPSTWESVPRRNMMIDHEFRAPKEAKEDAARITISMSAGGVDANIDRWIDQFEGVTKKDVKIEKKDVAGSTVHIVEISGTYKDSMSRGPFAPGASGPVKKYENYRMLSAIIETKNAGTVFIKMTGDQAIVEQLANDFKKSIDGLKAM